MGLSDKQKEFIEKADRRYNLKIGARRCGKTYLDTLYRIPKKIRELSGKDGLYVIFGVSKSTIERNVLQPMRQLYGGSLVSVINSNNIATLFNEEVYCLGCEKISQVSKIQGTSIKYAYADELAKYNRDVFEMIKPSLDKEYSTFDGALNPENKSHWLKKKFIDRIEEDKLDVYLQHYTIFDNPFLPQSFVDNICKEMKSAGEAYYNRLILGQWCNSEGLCFGQLAANPKNWIVSADKVPKYFDFVEAGLDLGGNASKHAITIAGITRDNEVYVLYSKKVEPKESNIADIFNMIDEAVNTVESKFRVENEHINVDHISVVANEINDNSRHRAGFAYKPPLTDRVFQYNLMFSRNKIHFVEGMCDDLIEEMSNIVFDEKSDKAIPLDDTKVMALDCYDSLTYSVSSNWHRLTD